MRKLLAITIVLASLWAGYWYFAAQAMEKGLSSWIEARRAEGWQGEYASLEVHGFPNRIDTTLNGLELADPETGLAWKAPFFQILSLSYQPNHVIVVWPGSQTIATPQEKITIESDSMQGSVVFDPGTDLPLNRASFVLEGVDFTSTRGWQAGLAGGQLALRQSVGVVNSYDISFQAHQLTPAKEFIRSIGGGAGLLPEVFDGMSVEATVGFTAPWDRYAIERARPQITTLDLKLLKAQWGDLDLWMAGNLSVDENGTPAGEITVKARNWREMVGIAKASGVLPEALAPTVEKALGFLSTLSGDPETLDAPLAIRDGMVLLGPFIIGKAPSLKIR